MSTATYIDGRTFLGIHGRYADQPFMRPPRAQQLFSLAEHPTWPELWTRVKQELRKAGCAESTLRLYRQVLRSLRDSGLAAPSQATRSRIRQHLHQLTDRDAGWSWTAANIGVIRAVFDKMAGCRFTAGLQTPKRPHALPMILPQHEVMEILSAAGTVRDQLVLGLLYGCGLKVGELCRLRWEDVDMAGERLRVSFARGTRTRSLPLPPALMGVLRRGVETCPRQDFIFQGRRSGSGLAPRTVEHILKQACAAAQVHKPVTCMTLRHSFAVHSLKMGITIVELQQALGHGSVETTLLYERCIPPVLEDHPFTKVRACYMKAVNPAHLPRASSLEGLDLPFPAADDGWLARTRDFYRTLKTRIFGRFLAVQGRSSPPE